MRFSYVLLLCCTTVLAQKVDFLKLRASLMPSWKERSIAGTCEFEFKVKALTDTIRIDAKNMDFTGVTLNGKPVNFKNNTKELLLYEGFKKGKNKLSFAYSATPKQALYFVGNNENRQIWSQGQGRYTSNWLPSFDDVNEKLIFTVSVFYDSKYTVLSNGVLKQKKDWKNNLTQWDYQMEKPMSSYLVMLATGNFVGQTGNSNSGVPLEWYIEQTDVAKFEPTYRYSKKVMDYLEAKIAVRYPWQVYRQVPVRDFIYAGMENTSATIFARDYVVDSVGFNDRNYVNVNAHELAHQWFGNLITAQSGKHHWLQEGFATYYALLAEREVFGDDYFYYQLYKTAIQLRNAAKNDTIPVLNEKASALTFYQKGAWALFYLNQKIGDKAFDKSVKKYLRSYRYKNVVTDDFLNYVDKFTDFDTNEFKNNWLEKSGFDSAKANQLLEKNKSIALLLKIRKNGKLTDKNYTNYLDEYRTILDSEVYYPVKMEIVSQISGLDFKISKDLLDKAITDSDFHVRQAVVLAYINKPIPSYLKPKIIKALQDSSYDTREIALRALCYSYPEEATDFLNIVQHEMGNNDLSLRMTYLQLAEQFSTNESEKSALHNELIGYTATGYESSVRQNAFELVLDVTQEPNMDVLRNLAEATTHIKWQFNKFAKDKIRALSKNLVYKEAFQRLIPSLSLREQTIVANCLVE